MLKRSVAIGVLLVPMLVIGCSQDPVVPGRSRSKGLDTPVAASAIVTPAAAEPVCVPFKVNGSPGSVQVTGGPPPAPLHITINADGEATHLGHYSSSANVVVTFP